MVQTNTLEVISSVQEHISCKQSLETEYQGTKNNKQKPTQFRERKPQKIRDQKKTVNHTMFMDNIHSTTFQNQYITTCHLQILLRCGRNPMGALGEKKKIRKRYLKSRLKYEWKELQLQCKKEFYSSRNLVYKIISLQQGPPCHSQQEKVNHI